MLKKASRFGRLLSKSRNIKKKSHILSQNFLSTFQVAATEAKEAEVGNDDHTHAQSFDLSAPLPITRPDLGHHLMMTFAAASPQLINSADALVNAITPILEAQGCTICNVKPQQFDPIGATVVWTLAESHFSIHTWPEHHTCVIDFFTCQPTAKEICTAVMEDLTVLFGATDKPESILECISIPRGVRVVQANTGEVEGQLHSMLLYAEEHLFEAKSPFQHIQVIDTGKGFYGKTLLLDGIVQIAETSDVYSEAMIRPVSKALGTDRVLIVGGGDCKIAKALLKGHNPEHISIVDLDELVTVAVMDHFPALRLSVAEQQKVSLFHEDALQWVKAYAASIESQDSPKFTSCIIDCTDPFPAGGISRSLFTSEFYKCLSECLESGASISQQYTHGDIDVSKLEEARYTDVESTECAQMEYFFPLSVVSAKTPRAVFT